MPINTTKIIPVVGSRGVFTLRAPFNLLIVEGVEYSCQAVRKISDYIANNEDPSALVYKKYNLPDTVYDEDKAEDAYVVCLQSEKGHWLYVPYRYVETFPTGDGIQYCSYILNFSLPGMPLMQDLNPLMLELQQRIKMALGTDVKMRITQSSQISLLTKEEHESAQLRRDLNKSGDGLIQTVVFLERQNQDLLKKLTYLENYVKAHLPP